jgi:AcrR family transcriptional regulator
MPRTQEERRHDAEEALLDAAATLFARRGIDQTSLAEVGEEAGYSRGLVNHHFGSKAALVERLATRSQHKFLASLGEVAHPEETGGRELDALVAIVKAYLGSAGQNIRQTRAFLVMWGAALPEEAALQPIFQADDAEFRRGIETLVLSGQNSGTIRSTIDPAGAALAIVGLLRGTAAQFLIGPEGIALTSARSACEKFVRQALAPGPEA